VNAPAAPSPIRFDEVIKVFDRPHRLGYRIIRSNLPIEHSGGLIQLEPAGAGTRALWTSMFRSTVPLLEAPTGALLALSLKRGFRRMLEDADLLAGELAS